MKKLLSILLFLSFLFCLISPVYASKESDAKRIFGDNRYDTAFKVADELKATLGVDKFENVIVASGTGFADALGGSYLAAKRNAPILMTDKKDANINKLVDYIKANLKDGGTVFILGGKAAVSEKVDALLEDSYLIDRLAGSDRYETNILILRRAGIAYNDILVCTGTNFADSLSASATGLPILLVGKELTVSQKLYLNTEVVPTNNVYIIGGKAAVSDAVAKYVDKSLGEVKRLSGAGRYDTSVLVAKEFFSNPTSAVVAYGKNFPDGLSGGALAYALHAPLLLAENKQANIIAKYTAEKKITSGYVLGGSGLVSDSSKDLIFKPKEKEEPRLVIYSPLSDAIFEAVIPAFEKETGIKTEIWSLGTGEMSERLEAEKDKPSADVVFGGINLHTKDLFVDVFESYISKNIDGVLEQYRVEDGLYTNYSLNGAGVLLLNNKVIEKLGLTGQINGYEDLLNPLLKGNVAFVNPTHSIIGKKALTNILYVMGEEAYDDKAWEYMKAYTEAFWAYDSASMLYKSVVFGELAVGIMSEEVALHTVAEGSDVTVVYPEEGTLMIPDASAIVKNCEHPENAKKFIDFLLSDKGQQALANVYVRGTNESVELTNENMKPISDIHVVYEDYDYIVEHVEEWIQKYNNLKQELDH